MNVFTYILMFILGACLGSFACLVSDRYPRNESYVHGRSHCEHCYRLLGWEDLIPVFSYLSLGGKCRYCGHELPIKLPLTEIIGGIVTVLAYGMLGFNIHMLTVLFMAFLSIIIALIDMETMDIYFSMITTLFFAGIVYRCFVGFHILDMILGALLLSAIMLAINYFFKDSFGIGDIELIFVYGIILGLDKVLIAMLIAIITGSLYALFLLITGKKDLTSYIAFGPFLVNGFIIAVLYGNIIVGYYLSVLFG